MAYIGKKPSDKFRGLANKHSFTGDGSTVAFDLANEAPDGGVYDLHVFIDNVRQEGGTGKSYTLGVDGSGDMKRITFASAPDSGSEVYVINPGRDSGVLQVGDNVVTSAKIASDAVTTAKILDSNVTTAKIVSDAITMAKLNLTYDNRTTATGDASTVAFTINSNRTVNDVLVIVNGVILVPTDDYTISSTTLTFVTAPSASAEIVVRYLPK
jgi:hypothetical protein